MRKKLRVFFLLGFCCTFFYLSFPKELNAIKTDLGGSLFNHNCAGCHINGGNIIRRSKNLKISSLKRNGIDNPEAIAKIARQGIGIMSGYEDELGDNGDQIVANWVWEQAQKAWLQE
ncbi:c-type cytochrome [Prochlorococcus sp. MIT 0916]|uniref:c-type cytochrome n=1 Tax=Prochlorococcus sp. MIT 0916 TaxID=3082521 RepID=UPI0039B4B49D